MKIFISYAHFDEDEEAAVRIYEQLKSVGQDPWVDKFSIAGGKDWNYEITEAIKHSRYFIAILSSNSVDKVGFIQKELRSAISKLDEFPPDSAFIIPVRINKCTPKHIKLSQLHWIDMFPKWSVGMDRLFQSLGIIEKVSFQDPYLLLAIRRAVGKPHDEITKLDIETLKTLKSQNMNITNLSGLERCVRLHDIDLSDNKIEDIEPLVELSNHIKTDELVYNYGAPKIVLNNNPLSRKAIIEDIPYIKNNGVLVDYIHFNDKNLEILIKAIRGTTYGSQDLYLDQLLKITEISIGQMPEVGGSQSINDLWGIQLCSNLSEFSLSSHHSLRIPIISDLLPLKNLANLEVLSIGMPEHLFHVKQIRGEIRDLSPLANLRKLRILTLVAQKISDIQPLSKLASLEKIDLSCNHISNIEPLAEIVNIKSISLAQNEIKNISPIEKLNNLDKIIIYNNKVEINDLSPLVKLFESGALRGSITLDPPKNNKNSEECISYLRNKGANIRLISGYDWYATW